MHKKSFKFVSKIIFGKKVGAHHPFAQIDAFLISVKANDNLEYHVFTGENLGGH
jgi:hypothetical protein